MKNLFTSNYDLTDIVFEGRNKDYGAYQLRKSYNTTMLKSKVITLSVVSLLSALFLFQKKEITPLPQTYIGIPVDLDNIYVEPEKPLEQVKPKAQEQIVPPKETIKNVEPKIVEDDKVKTDEVMATNDQLEGKESGTETEINPKGSENATIVEPEKTGSSESGTENLNGTFISVEVMPEFIGGNDKLFKFIGNHLRYPAMAVENGIQGTVAIQFIVDQTGQVINVNVLRGIGGGCDEEAIRVVKLLKFKPGRQNGTAVKVQFSLPIRFKLD